MGLGFYRWITLGVEYEQNRQDAEFTGQSCLRVNREIDEGLMKVFSCYLRIMKEQRIEGELKMVNDEYTGRRPVCRP